MTFNMTVRIDDEAKPATPIAANSLLSATDIPSRLGATYAIANAVRFTRDNFISMAQVAVWWQMRIAT